jgi:hypothetical protein
MVLKKILHEEWFLAAGRMCVQVLGFTGLRYLRFREPFLLPALIVPAQ